MMSSILEFYDKSVAALNAGADIEAVVALPSRERIGRLKYVAEDKVKAEYDSILAQLSAELSDAVSNKDN
jgi:V/A-type H+-transporting ATPase subunit A